MFKCFKPFSKIDRMDAEPFQLSHNLSQHPSLTLEALAKSIPELAPHQVMFSKGLSDIGIDFDRAHIDHKNGLDLMSTFEKLKTTSSYIAVKNPETHPAFSGVFADLIADATRMTKIRGLGNKVLEPTLWLFIASPGAVTPFHFDRYSNFLLQIRGSKEVVVFPPLDQRVISAADYEAYMDREVCRPPWKPEINDLGQKFSIVPGDSIHIPFTGGHYVVNGTSDISITLSLFFQTKQTMRLTRAMQLNHRLRKRLARFGMAPTFVGQSKWLDAFKSSMLPLANLVGKVMGLVKRRKDFLLHTTSEASAPLPEQRQQMAASPAP